MSNKPYPTDVSNEEWSCSAPYLNLMDLNAPQRKHDLREVFNALRWLAQAGAPWRLLPNNKPPWAVPAKPALAQCRLLRDHGV
ncbi:transposase [Delftia acidovorans]|uniref:transposase n=1 Tax=Delftia acidovorans TaxID=80866 RepID=UPI003A5C5236